MKKLVKSAKSINIDFENDDDFQIYDKVYSIVNYKLWDAIDELVNSELPQAQELEKQVPGYNSEWCPEEGDEFAKDVKKVVVELCEVLTDNYFADM